MDFLKNAKGHFKTITKHKCIVMDECFRVGLYKQGLLHDLSKYKPVEFLTGVKYYQGDRSPNTYEKELKGFSTAWLHHKGRNKHHFEYWIDYEVGGSHKLVGHKMPTRYVIEMFLDRVAACKVYYGDDYKDSSALEYFEKRKYYYHMHKDTINLLEKLLKRLAKYGEEETFLYIKEKIEANKKKRRTSKKKQKGLGDR